MPDLTDSQLLEAFNGKMDLSLLSPSEQQRLLVLTEPAKTTAAPTGPPVTRPQRLAAEGPSAMRGPDGPNGEAPRMVAAHPYATAALLGAGAAAPFIPAGATAVEAAYPGMLKDVAKLAGVGLGYRAGKAFGVPEGALDVASLAAGYDPAMNIRSIWKGGRAVPPSEPLVAIPKLGPLRNFEPPPNTTPPPPLAPLRPDAPPTRMQPPPLAPLRPEPVSPSTPAPPLAPLRPNEAQAPRIVSVKPPPLSPNTRSSWPSGEPPVPQQTSSIQPTPNAYVNVDKGAPLPTDEARTFSTGVADPGERARMSETHTVLNQENNAYRAMKNDAGPDAGADTRRGALLKKRKGTTAADLTPTVGPALLQALLDSLKTGGR